MEVSPKPAPPVQPALGRLRPSMSTLVVIALVICGLPVFVPDIWPKDDSLPMYLYCAFTEFLPIPFAILLARRESGAARIAWYLAAAQFFALVLCYLFISASYLGLLHYTSSAGLGIAFSAASIALCLFALVGVSESSSNRHLFLDAGLVLIFAALFFAGIYSPHTDFRLHHLSVSFFGIAAVALIAVASWLGAAAGVNLRFARIFAIYLVARALSVFFVNIVNNHLLAHPRMLPFDLLFAPPDLLFCLLVAAAIRYPNLFDRPRPPRPVLQTLAPSLIALTGILIAPLALTGHPILVSFTVSLLAFVYVVRTHVHYSALLHQQQLLSSRAGQLEHVATRDPLTAIGNRRWFEHTAARLLALEAPEVSLLLIDVDRFKSINDRHGHTAGDHALRAVANILSVQAAAVPHACCARLGGDEFVLLLPYTGHDPAAAIAHQIRSQLDLVELPIAQRVTLSIGLTVGRGSNLSLRQLLEDADRAMYAAKAQGRDLLVAAQ